jgi:putative ABC transport system substrate-binding protein
MTFIRALSLLTLILCSAALSAAEVGVLWFGKSGMAENVLRGFVARMRETAPDVKLEIKTNLPDLTAAEPIFEGWQTSKQGVVFLRSDGAKYLIAHPPKIPTFLGACNNPAELGVIKDLAKPEGNITGVTYSISIEKQISTFLSIVPTAKSLGLLLEKGHASASIESTGAKTAAEKLGLSLTISECSSKEELAQSVSDLTGKVDILILGNQALLIDNGALVASLAKKIPVMSFTEKPVLTKSALCGLVADDVKLGGLLADQVIAVVVKGTPIKDVPVKFDDAPRFLWNKAKATELGIALPESLAAGAKIIE